MTTLVLKVPANAEVLLDGNKTDAQGEVRTFSTRKLDNEEAWENYEIKVRYFKDGQEVVKTQSLDLVAGATKVVAIDDSELALKNVIAQN